jgi:hypothetical protein
MLISVFLLRAALAAARAMPLALAPLQLDAEFIDARQAERAGQVAAADQ